MQAEVDALKEELDDEKFLSSIGSPVKLPSQPSPWAAPEAAPGTVSEAALEVEELKAMLSTAREEARLSAEAAEVASGSIGGLRAIVTDLECKLEKATRAQANGAMRTLRKQEPKEKLDARLERAREEARAAREEARVAHQVARALTEAKMVAIVTINELRSLVAELEHKLEATRNVELRTVTKTKVGPEDYSPEPGLPRSIPGLVPNKSLLDKVYETYVEVTIGKGRVAWQQEQQTKLLEMTESVTKPVAAGGGLPTKQAVDLADGTKAALKIQAVARGWSGRNDFKLVRDEEACRQWVAYHVALGEYEEAERLGWDGDHPSPPSKREPEANVMNESSVEDDEPLIPARGSDTAATQRPPRYRRTRSSNTAVRASPLAIIGRSPFAPATSTVPAKGSHSPEYRQQETPDWLIAGERAVNAAVTVQAKEDIGQITALLRSDPHQGMLELARDVEACRQWVAYHVARGEYKDALELGWDGANPPPAPTEQIQASLAGLATDRESPKDICTAVFAQDVIEINAHASAAHQEASIEVVARPSVKPHPVMIEVVADISKARPAAFIAAVEAAAAAATVEAAAAATAEVAALAAAEAAAETAVAAAEVAEAAAGRVAEVKAAASEKKVQKRGPSEMIDVRPINLQILERQASFLESAKASERLEESANIEASARVNERLERARKHNKQVARLAAASTTVGRLVRGQLTRLRLRREREAARMAEMQRETERAWAKTVSRPSPSGRRGKLTRRQHVLAREAANAYFNLGRLPPRDSEVAKHARDLASAITQRRADIEERNEGIRQGRVVVVDPRVPREKQLREKKMEVNSSCSLQPDPPAFQRWSPRPQHNSPTKPQPNPRDYSHQSKPLTKPRARSSETNAPISAQVAAPQLRGPAEMPKAFQARREPGAPEKTAAIAEAKRPADVDSNGSNRPAPLDNRGPRTTSMSSEYKHAEKTLVNMPDESPKDAMGDIFNKLPSVTSTSGGGEEEWQRARDQSTGKKYFWNLRTNEVRWFTEEEESEAEKAEEEGWERVFDQASGKEYFWHNVTDEVRWTEPPELAMNRAAAE